MAATNLEGLIIELNVIQLLIQKLQDSSPKVRRASFDLFFELIEYCFDHAIRLHLRKILCYFITNCQCLMIYSYFLQLFLADCMPILSATNLMALRVD